MIAMLPQNDISDMHLSFGTGDKSIFSGSPNRRRPAGSEHMKLIAALEEAITPNPLKKLVELEDGQRWRVQRMREGRYALRWLRPEAPPIDALGMPAWIKKLLLASDLRDIGGLILICGQAGAGKTTTFGATITRRLEIHGGYCLTIEDPPEDKLEGCHGEEGFCEQMDVEEVGGYASAIRAALRCYPAKDPAMLGYGEVIEDATAAQILRLGGDGHLVIFTFHSKTIEVGLQRLAAMARAAGEVNADELLSANLQLVVHQRFDQDGKLEFTALPRDSKVVAHIKDGNYAALEPLVLDAEIKHLSGG